jgi:hypothetical protein
VKFLQQTGVLQRASGFADEHISCGMGEKDHRV